MPWCSLCRSPYKQVFDLDFLFVCVVGVQQVLRLARNRLQSLPEALGAFSALQVLDCSGNRLTSVPRVVGRCTALQQLLMSSNRLRGLTSGIGNLMRLQLLDLSHNQYRHLPTMTGDLTQLQVRERKAHTAVDSTCVAGSVRKDIWVPSTAGWPSNACKLHPTCWFEPCICMHMCCIVYLILAGTVSAFPHVGAVAGRQPVGGPPQQLQCPVEGHKAHTAQQQAACSSPSRLPHERAAEPHAVRQPAARQGCCGAAPAAAAARSCNRQSPATAGCSAACTRTGARRVRAARAARAPASLHDRTAVAAEPAGRVGCCGSCCSSGRCCHAWYAAARSRGCQRAIRLPLASDGGAIPCSRSGSSHAAGAGGQQPAGSIQCSAEPA